MTGAAGGSGHRLGGPCLALLPLLSSRALALGSRKVLQPLPQPLGTKVSPGHLSPQGTETLLGSLVLSHVSPSQATAPPGGPAGPRCHCLRSLPAPPEPPLSHPPIVPTAPGLAQPIYIEASSSHVAEGQTLDLNCVVPGQAHAQVTWYKRGGSLPARHQVQGPGVGRIQGRQILTCSCRLHPKPSSHKPWHAWGPQGIKYFAGRSSAAWELRDLGFSPGFAAESFPTAVTSEKGMEWTCRIL